jgi:hypothetical protein
LLQNSQIASNDNDISEQGDSESSGEQRRAPPASEVVPAEPMTGPPLANVVDGLTAYRGRRSDDRITGEADKLIQNCSRTNVYLPIQRPIECLTSEVDT